jgi:type II secretory pathway component PulF
MADEETKKEDERRFTDEIRKTLRRDLREREMSPVVVEEETGRRLSLYRIDILWRLRPINLRQMINFTRELSILLHSGMPLLRGLRTLAKRAGNEKLRRILHRVSVKVENGSAFWEALASFPHVFSTAYMSTVRTGEMSGKLESALEVLAKFYETEYSLRRKLRRALFYPVVVLVMAFIIIIVLSATVMPVFADLFEEVGADLPLLTRILIGTADFIHHFWYLPVIVVALLGIGYWLLRQTVGGKLLIDRLRLKIPVFGPLYLRMLISRFTRTFAILFESGVPILETLNVCAEACENEIVARKLDEIRQGVERGDSFEKCLEDPGVFPPLLVDMLIVGEEAGALESVLNRVAGVYEEETSDIASTLATAMEPVLLIMMGALVAFVFSSLFVPYIELISRMGGM